MAVFPMRPVAERGPPCGDATDDRLRGLVGKPLWEVQASLQEFKGYVWLSGNHVVPPDRQYLRPGFLRLVLKSGGQGRRGRDSQSEQPVVRILAARRLDPDEREFTAEYYRIATALANARASRRRLHGKVYADYYHDAALDVTIFAAMTYDPSRGVGGATWVQTVFRSTHSGWIRHHLHLRRKRERQGLSLTLRDTPDLRREPGRTDEDVRGLVGRVWKDLPPREVEAVVDVLGLDGGEPRLKIDVAAAWGVSRTRVGQRLKELYARARRPGVRELLS